MAAKGHIFAPARPKLAAKHAEYFSFYILARTSSCRIYDTCRARSITTRDQLTRHFRRKSSDCISPRPLVSWRGLIIIGVLQMATATVLYVVHSRIDIHEVGNPLNKYKLSRHLSTCCAAWSEYFRGSRLFAWCIPVYFEITSIYIFCQRFLSGMNSIFVGWWLPSSYTYGCCIVYELFFFLGEVEGWVISKH